jgi:hypothetical protein
MATIRLKRRTSGATGSPSSLAVGEPAYNEVDDTLWIGLSSGATKAIGGLGNFVALTGTQTVGGAKTFSGAATFSSTATFTGTTSLATATATTPSTSDNSTNVATTAYVRAQNYLPNTTRLDQLVAAGADYSMGGFKLTNLAAPVNPNDAARKADVDAAANGLDVKLSVRAATTANITLSGAQTIDGVSVVAGDRVLVKNQTTTTQNGIYVAASGAWARSSDADTNAEVHAGMFTFVTEGTTNADSGWVLATNDPITLGTTSLTFAQFSGGGVPAGYIGQTTITTLGTIATGTWQATTIAPAYGGTGLTSVLNGLVKGNGTVYSAAVAGTDYLDNNSTIDGGTY